MSRKYPSILRNRKARIARRLKPRGWSSQSAPMFSGSNIHFGLVSRICGCTPARVIVRQVSVLTIDTKSVDSQNRHRHGAVVERYTYDIFGAVTIKDGSGNTIGATAYANRFLFTGREWLAEISLYDYRNRIYSQEVGRFLQTDPVRFDAGDINLYRYVGNEPIDRFDPNGLNWLSNWGSWLMNQFFTMNIPKPPPVYPFNQPWTPAVSAYYGNTWVWPFWAAPFIPPIMPIPINWVGFKPAFVTTLAGNTAKENCMRGCLMANFIPGTGSFIFGTWAAHNYCAGVCNWP